MPQSPRTILHVGSDEPGRRALSEALARAGFAVCEAASGEDSLRLATTNPDLVLLHAPLPDLDIAEVCRRLKADPAEAPTILVLGAGEGLADACLTAPARPDEVVTLVKVLLRARRAEAALRARGAGGGQATRTLAESEALFRGIFETANEGIWVLDDQARVTLVNPRMADMLGYVPEEMVGRLKWDFLFEEDRPRVMALFERRRAGVSEQADVRFRHRDGREVWTLLAARPVLGAAGEFRGALDLFTDITERKRLEEELRRRAERLAEADHRKDEFLALLGHELRNPLAPIRTAVQLLEPNGDDLTVVARAREIIDRQVRQMTRLVDELLDAGRIARGKVQLRRERLDLTALVRAAAGDYRADLEAGGLTPAVEVPAGPVWVWGDAVRLTQVVGNLLHNSQKSTDPGGRVAVRLAVADGLAALSVEDTGIGIAAEALPKLFEAFSQVDAAPERNRGGLGLGLAVVKGLVELHGGRVEAASAGLGRGARFTAWVPLDSGQESPQPPEEPVGAAAGGPRKVLIIEDNRDAAESLRLFLAAHGHEVTVAPTGPQGVEQARQFRPDLVLCDLGLPGMSGFDVARALRADPGTAAALLISVSGYGQEQDCERARAAGFDEVLVKPVDPRALGRLVARPRA
jgi:PAS domain S-box-containing protein